MFAVSQLCVSLLWLFLLHRYTPAGLSMHCALYSIIYSVWRIQKYTSKPLENNVDIYVILAATNGDSKRKDYSIMRAFVYDLSWLCHYAMMWRRWFLVTKGFKIMFFTLLFEQKGSNGFKLCYTHFFSSYIGMWINSKLCQSRTILPSEWTNTYLLIDLGVVNCTCVLEINNILNRGPFIYDVTCFLAFLDPPPSLLVTFHYKIVAQPIFMTSQIQTIFFLISIGIFPWYRKVVININKTDSLKICVWKLLFAYYTGRILCNMLSKKKPSPFVTNRHLSPDT